MTLAHKWGPLNDGPRPFTRLYGLVTGPRSAFLPLMDHEATFLEAQRRPLANPFCPEE